MNKSQLLQKFQNPEDKILISRILDKIKFCETRNKITYTNFLDLRQKAIAQKILTSMKITNYIFFGGFSNAERTCLIFYPQKFSIDFVMNHLDEIIQSINITLPKELHNTYTHKKYLGGIIKLGIEREKIGDILVRDNGSNIIVCADISNSLTSLLSSLTRFRKSEITITSIKNIDIPEIKKEEVTIIVPSLRLDSVTSSLAHTSRNKALEIISAERVLVNFETCTKYSKILNYGDIVTIRGKGRFEIGSLKSTSKSGNLVVLVYKYA